jgi:predicted helicase
MSQVLIQQYLRELADIKRMTGSSNETVLREAFKALLKDWGKSKGLFFTAEYPIENAAFKHKGSVDGALLYELRRPFGYWEAKDENDDIDLEIEKKFKRGYPQDNILFEDTRTLVLIQNREEVGRCDMTDALALERFMNAFFSFERPEIAQFRQAIEQFKLELPAILEALRSMIASAHAANPAFSTAAQDFLEHCRSAINPSVTQADVREMLLQHILTEEIFAHVFNEGDFHRQNNIAQSLYELEAHFFTGALKKNILKSLEPYYAAIRASAAEISSHSEKQKFLKAIYENFYQVYNRKAADRLGVVYTPNEIVRFMIEATDWLTQTHFSKNLIHKDVEILDPATGTGTFICELLEYFKGNPKQLAHKFLHELHANEVAILPYYVANLNIEATYAAIAGEYAEFPNLCFMDTLDNMAFSKDYKGAQAGLDMGFSDENVARIKRQNSKKISVIIGNPPYNANQLNENDNNKNREYPHIDARIKQTYIAESTAQKTKLYDMYARFFRWASDRLNDNGVLAMITNRSFIDSRTFDGFRKVLAQEFNEVWVVDLGGDVRANPKLSGTKHNVFGIQTGVAISFLVKKKNANGCHIHYARRPEFDTAEDKLAFISKAKLDAMRFERIAPDGKHNWLNITDNDFETLIPLANKDTKAAKSQGQESAIFKHYTLGVSTNRDEWVIDNKVDCLENKIKGFLDVYKTQLGVSKNHDLRIKWSETLKRRALNRVTEPFQRQNILRESYRPFVSKFIYASALLIDRPGSMDRLFKIVPTICITGPNASKPFHALATQAPFGLDFLEKTFGFQKEAVAGISSVDNITDWGLAQFVAHYGEKVTKEGIFHYVYAVLHNPAYREKYAPNLKREFPRVPLYGKSLKDFERWASWGAALMALHIGYETVAPFDLQRVDIAMKTADDSIKPKTKLKADKDAGKITIDEVTTLSGIPPQAWAYKLGNRSALEWVLDQYKESKPKDPTIREQFDTYRFADYKDHVIDLLQRVCAVSVQTQTIVAAMVSD